MSVKAIDRRTVHQICSGQVVLTLAVAVKELVENSLDAGATVIEIRLKEHGSELVEVCDNGCGVEEDNFQALTLKHHTSKISNFADLEMGVTTFGFRGEALSSLCALSNLTVTTCHKSQVVGTKLEYDSNGRIVNKASCAREVGTTVSLSNLFHTLPVRHKEFHRNIKKEFHKMIQMLQGYCLVSTGVRIMCYNQVGKGKKQLVMSTSGGLAMKNNIIDVFGLKQFQQLVEVTPCSAEDLSQEEEESTSLPPGTFEIFRFSGYISRCNHGYGRSATDRQFYFFNDRPVDHQKLGKTVNEVYHTYNRHQYPFVVLNIETARDHVDVNITPDKRQVMLQQEKALLLFIKVSLMKLFEPMQQLYDTNQAECSMASTPSPLTPSTSSLSRFASLKRSFSHNLHGNGNEKKLSKNGSLEPKQKQAKLFDYGAVKTSTPLCDSSSLECGNETLKSVDLSSVNSDEELELPLPLKESTSMVLESSSTILYEAESSPERQETTDYRDTPGDKWLKKPGSELSALSRDSLLCGTTEVAQQSNPIQTHFNEPAVSLCDTPEIILTPHTSVPTTPNDSCTDSPVAMVNNKHQQEDGSQTNLLHGSHTPSSSLSHLVFDKNEEPCVRERSTATLHVDIDAIAKRLSRLKSEEAGVATHDQQRLFTAKINPSSNSDAEAELRKQISKSDFSKMHIIGQFNLGFIITLLGSDLFIIDQHATDEKYNFERLQRETILQHQKLLQPMALELTAAQESVVMDNLEVFKINGLHFQIDPEAAPTKRVKLIGQPVSKSWSLGPKDIDELIFMLSDGGCSPGEVLRPSAVRAMFASRACRSSIMVGTALNTAQMNKLVEHMGDMKTDQPWNCPHGRPTMRHLIDLSRL